MSSSLATAVTSPPSPSSKSGYMASCSPFSVTDTSSTTQNYASCNTIACAGDTLTFLLSEHTGDYYFLLFDGSGIKVAEWNLFLKYSVPANTGCTNYEIREGCSGSGSCGGTLTTISIVGVSSSQYSTPIITSTGTFLASNNDYCGQCSALAYTVVGGTTCSTYVLREACNGFGSCSGTASIKIHSPSPTTAPTTLPTMMPSKSPSRPTVIPSIVPSAPSIKPSSPTLSPTSVPSLPTVSPSTRKPTFSPTLFSVMYTYTGSVQTYSVGAGRYSVTITACGAQGRSTAYSTGGLGGCITTSIDVAPFQTLYIFVGGAGATSSYNGGGAVLAGSSGTGGGASDVRAVQNDIGSRLVVGGGGGGAGYDGTAGGLNGGVGGGNTGGTG
eukprot:gene35405-45871_t